MLEEPEASPVSWMLQVMRARGGAGEHRDMLMLVRNVTRATLVSQSVSGDV